MTRYQNVFERVEKKYLLTKEQHQKLMPAIERYMQVDKYGKTAICNIYFDTDDFRIIRNSIEKPPYKEKLRLRSYGVPTWDSTVFVELKKKVMGVVYKRRVAMTYAQAMEYLTKKKRPFDSQILDEIDYFIDFYNQPAPKVVLTYDRTAMFGREDPDLRITIDDELKWRDNCLDLTKGIWGSNVINEPKYLMEIKLDGAMPLWLVAALNECGAYHTSFSKYGTVYSLYLYQKFLKGNNCCA